ncbi:MAG: ABC transporter permease [archaeon]
MKLSKIIKLAFNILIHSKLRSWLTVLGIVIGVGAFVTILAIGDGLKKDINSRMNNFELDIITITPGYSRAGGRMPDGGGGGEDFGGRSSITTSENTPKLTNKDIQILKSIKNIKYIQKEISGKAEVYYLGESADLSITGVDESVWKDITTAELSSGRLLNVSDKYSAVIGYRLANEVFKQAIPLNRTITIDNKQFRVIGIFKSGTNDNSIYIPIDIAADVITDKEVNSYDRITVKVNSENDVNQVATDINDKLMLSRHVTTRDKDFTVTDMKSRLTNISDMSSSITLFLGAIAAVSLIVGAVGIANTMFTSVLEKIKDIGIMKSIGAQNKDILLIFVFNSSLFGLVGGILGVFLAFMLTTGLPLLGVRFIMGGTLTPVFSIHLAIYGVVLAVIIGTIAGIIPAYNASKLKPVDALRYE